MGFRKVLVANRGEIAVRVIRGLREAGITSVAIYSDADRRALHVRCADEAVYVGPSPSAESYLNIERVIDAARKHHVDAIHPGYGFLSENAAFAEACDSAGLKFIGPSALSIAKMGSKTEARKLAVSVGAPVIPGSPEKIDFPVIVKAAAGGGGKGMRRVDTERELEGALRDAASEAGRAFGNSEVYIEKLIERPRHIEIQVLGDEHGNLIHLGERECSLQRRHQKVVEESPSPLVAASPKLRAEMGETALAIARAAGYFNAGTLEFLVDENNRFYFLEMNTRLQVEHAVTELVTGLDLVSWQLRIAAGERLTLDQNDVSLTGWAMQCRLYAEDPEMNFMPSPGKITSWSMPEGPGFRVDSGAYNGWDVPIDYDPLLAKIITRSGSRPEVIERMCRAMDEAFVSGIRTNIAFFRSLLRDDEFGAGRIHTGFIDEFLKRRPQIASQPDAELAAALVAAVISKRQPDRHERKTDSAWLREGRSQLLR